MNFEFGNKNKITSPVKWIGGKSQLLPILCNNLPEKFNDYYELFVGGGALLFELQPKSFIINDVNSELITTYNIIKEDVENLISKLTDLQNEYNTREDKQEMYYSMRSSESVSDLDVASRFIFLNKLCFNGLYRINREGKFNSPWNHTKSIKLYDYDNLIALHNYLKTSAKGIYNGSYQLISCLPKEGDLVYLDPPYDPLKNSGKTCTDYTANGFTKEDQVKLSEYFRELGDRGVYCMESNHNTELIRELYKDFNIEIVKAKRMVNCKGTSRGEVEEVLIKNY